MGFIFSLAMKNLFRYKRRTIITAIAIAAGLAVYIWVDAFMAGIELESQRNMMWYETGSAQVLNRDYFAEKDYLPLKYVIENPDEIISFLKENNIPATKRITMGGELFFFPADQERDIADATDRSRNLKFFGLDLATADRVFKLKNVLVDKKQYLTEGSAGILLGQALARDMQIEVGDNVQVRTRSRYGNEVVLDLEVAGLVNCPNPVIDKGTGFIPLSVLNEALDMEGGVTDIPVLFPEWKNAKKEAVRISKLLSPRFGNLDVKDWDDLSGNIMYAQSKKKMIGLLLVLVAIIAAVGIINTMLMAVFERIREIGMMRALGMLDKDIRRAFVIEAGGIGLIGSVIGVAIGFLLTFFSVYWGFDVSAFVGNMDLGYRIYGVFRASWNPATMIVTFFLGIIASVLVALYPAGKALKIDITDCLRHQ